MEASCHALNRPEAARPGRPSASSRRTVTRTGPVGKPSVAFSRSHFDRSCFP